MGAGRLRSHKTLSPTGTCQYVVTLAPQRSVELSGLIALGTTRRASLPRPLQERPRSLGRYKKGFVVFGNCEDVGWALGVLSSLRFRSYNAWSATFVLRKETHRFLSASTEKLCYLDRFVIGFFTSFLLLASAFSQDLRAYSHQTMLLSQISNNQLTCRGSQPEMLLETPQPEERCPVRCR